MTGAIIGDLAAWTWEHDKDVFYRQLVADDAYLSGCGLSILAIWEIGRDKENFDEMVQPLKEYLLKYSDPCDVDRKWIDCVLSGFQQWEFSCLAPLLIAGVDIKAWDDRASGGEGFATNVPDLGKDGFYVKHLGQIINRLRYGATKHEAMTDDKDTCFIPSLVDWYKLHKNNHYAWADELMMYVSYALKCFSESWDFTSAIHNAMRCPHSVDLHLLGMITGAIAEAMYGCSHCLLKQKYAVNGAVSVKIDLPRSLWNDFQSDLIRLREYESEKRVFFPKNASRTNVERQIWIPWKAERLPEDFHPEYHRRLLKSYEPGWDYRYSVYLDDGWFYLCRSFFLIARFRMLENKDGRWIITDTQRCRSEEDAQIAMDEVLNVIVHRWYLVSEEEEPGRIDFCRYYRWQPECPFPAESPQGLFWHGEMMFVKDGLDMEEWKRKALSSVRGMDEQTKEKFLSYSEEQRAVLCYISNLYAKWRPYDNQDWIFEYGR